MGKMQSQIPFPSEFYNTIMILVTIFTILWGIKATKRLYCALRVRSAAITDRIIHIRGLGSYLSYFEGAYQPHLNAIVHTRQTKPSVDTNVVYVPFSVNDAHLKRNFEHNYDVQLSVSTPIPSKVVLFFNFKSINFKTMVSRFRKMNPNNVYEDSNSQRIFLENLFQLGSLAGGNGEKQDIRQSNPANLSGTSEFECIVRDLPKGSHTFTVNLLESMTMSLDSRLMSIVARPPLPETGGGVMSAAAAPAVEVGADGSLPPSETSGTSSIKLEEDSLQIGVLIVPSFSFDSSRNPLYKPSKKQASSSSSSPLHSSGNRASVSPSGESAGPQGRDSDGPLMEFDMATNSMHDGLMMKDLDKSYTDEESGNVGNIGGGSSSSSSSSPQSAGVAPPRQAVSCAAMYSFSIPMGTLLTASSGPGWTHLRPSKAALTSTSPSRVNNPLAAPPAPISVPMAISEMFLFDLSNQLYSSQEIFGLGPSAVVTSSSSAAAPSELRPAENLLDLAGSSATSAEGSSSPTPVAPAAGSSTAAAAVACGGKYVTEDCVVCLTDPKEIALLPCRHLCVCVGCLIYIDKCPVCRAAFEEYVVIQSSKELSVSVPSLTEPITIKL